MPGKKVSPLADQLLKKELKVTTIPHPNPYVVRIKVEWVEPPRMWLDEMMTPEELAYAQRVQAAYYQNLMRGDHIHVEVKPMTARTTRGLAPEVW